MAKTKEGILPKKRSRVTFSEKASFQKDDCLYCAGQATIQANFSRGTVSAQIRCCENSKCKKLAAELAKKSAIRLTS